MKRLPCFKAYDIRGRVPEELNENTFWHVGQSYARLFSPQKVVIGQDARATSATFADVLAKSLRQAGVAVQRIGLCCSEDVYFSTFHYGLDAGFMVTASHNPMEFNGLKIVKEGAAPLGPETELQQLHDDMQQCLQTPAPDLSALDDVGEALSHRDDYVAFLLKQVDVSALKPLKIVMNAGNGVAGPVIDALETHLPFEIVKVHFEPDGRFPNGIPNPVEPHKRAATIEAIKTSGADFGVAWDGDADRCCLFDETGTYMNGYYIVGLLAEHFMKKSPGDTVVYEPRLNWNTLDIAAQYDGKAVPTRVGHGYIKEKMREVQAIFGGEASCHYFFRDFAFCDSGMLPWLIVAEMVSATGFSLGQLIAARQEKFCASEEVNFELRGGTDGLLEKIESRYEKEALSVDKLDGLSMAFDTWRFNVRQSKNEPWLVRLNLEVKGDAGQLPSRVEEISTLLKEVAQAA